ncbi:MAG: ABC transporter permease [Eubacteriales bacterium]|nr:ABC transporter permease [Eubacteriales bacterium]
MDIVILFNALPGALAQGLIWGVMAIGVYVTYKILDLADLTVDGTMCTGGAVCVMLMLNGHSIGFSLFCAFLAGMLAGLVTGIFHTALGIPAILAGILSQLGLYSINLRIMGNRANQTISVNKYKLLIANRDNTNAILVVGIIILVLIAVLYWFFGTELGCSIRATGSNQNMSRAQGINTDFTKILGLMLSNGIVAFASGLNAQYSGFADVNAGRGAIVIGLAAVIIGEVLLGKISRNFAFHLLSVVVGAVIYYFVIQVVLWLGLNTNDLKLFSALVVAAFLAIPYVKGKYFAKPVKKGGVPRA